MYCPKCGITIGDVGNFCARCGKNVSYLRGEDAAEENLATNPAVDDGDQADFAGAESSGEVAAKSNAAGKKSELPEKTAATFYCSYCGTMVYGEDNFCYDCSKELPKKYYGEQKKKRNYKLWTIVLITFAAAVVISYRFFSVYLHAR